MTALPLKDPLPLRTALLLAAAAAVLLPALVVVLAQASMAPAVALLGGLGVEVLASPLLGVQSAVDRLARLGRD